MDEKEAEARPVMGTIFLVHVAIRILGIINEVVLFVCGV